MIIMLDNRIIKKKLVSIVSIASLIVVIGLWFAAYFSLKDDCETDRGTFGDMFGSVNALFSGLALAGIIVTILMQKQELELQRKELRQTRKEFKIQNDTLRLQRFENTFFNLLSLHHQIVREIDFSYYKHKERDRILDSLQEEKELITIKGRDVFRHRYNKLRSLMQENPGKWEATYLSFYETVQSDFGHYFRNLYRMVRLVNEAMFIDGGESSEKEIFKIKYKYTSIIRAQLSDYELLWVFYNCIAEYGEEKFKPLVEEYSLLKNLPSDKLVSTLHKNYYHGKAFDPMFIEVEEQI